MRPPTNLESSREVYTIIDSPRIEEKYYILRILNFQETTAALDGNKCL